MKYELTATENNIVTNPESEQELIEAWTASLKLDGLADRTVDTYTKGAKQFMRWAREQGGIITSDSMREYRAYLLQEYKPGTVSNYITCTRNFFKFLESEGLIAHNIAANLKGAKASPGFKKDVFTMEETEEILSLIDTDTIEGKRDYAILSLLFDAGLRTVEVERANIGDIRFSMGDVVLYLQGKGRLEKDDFVVLSDTTYPPIRDYLRARGETNETAPLFASESNHNKGERLTTRSIRRIVKNAFRAAGFDSDRLTAHSCRHTAITTALENGASIQAVQRMARHKSINTTMIYAHNIDRLRNSPEKQNAQARLEYRQNHERGAM